VKSNPIRREVLALAAAVLLAPAWSQSSAASDADAELDAIREQVERLYQAGRFEEALPLAQRELEQREKTLSPEHPDVVTALNNLAARYYATGDYARAKPLIERALAINEKALGPEHSDVATSLNNLASLYLTTGDYARAEPLYDRALTIREKALGPEHPDVAMSLNNLAWLYRTTGDYARAEPLYERALAGLSRAAEIRERQITLLLPAVSDRRGLAYMATVRAETAILLSFQRANPENAPIRRLALTTVLRRKGRVLDATAGGMRALERQLGEEDRAALADLLSKRARLARAVLARSGAQPAELLAALRTEVEEAERAALRRS
jgi:tetratricopeptide (TPR) repeat protein